MRRVHKVYLELISGKFTMHCPHFYTKSCWADTMWPNGFIGKRHIQTAIKEINRLQLGAGNSSGNTIFVDFVLCRVPFFLEPMYLDEHDSFTESHETRMVRKFGSKEAFEKIKLAHDLGQNFVHLFFISSNNAAFSRPRSCCWFDLWSRIHTRKFIKAGSKLNDALAPSCMLRCPGDQRTFENFCF